ncbi:hypothetical protein N431DRAFT_515224 [Stipitochalara longipes BDJ]|nr:hypothetical protein N431DRAFT_515224 [Stipitochalara longipes BDJ]
MFEHCGDPANAGNGGYRMFSWSHAMVFMEAFTSHADAVSYGGNSENINMGSSSCGKEASPSLSPRNHITTSTTTVAAEPNKLSKFIRDSFGKVPKKFHASATDKPSSNWDTVPDAFHDSGVEIDNSTIVDRLESGHWDENLVKGFDNEHRTFINSEEKFKAFLPVLLRLKKSTLEEPELSCDCEGCSLGRHGTLTIFQMRVRSLQHTYVFDVLALGGRIMFEMEGEEGQSLKKLLESQQSKVFWDVRQDSDAMLHHFGVRLGGIIDAQLMEIASRNSPQRDRIFSLFTAVTVERKAWMIGDEFWEWKQSFNEAKDYFNESNYECFNIRPLTCQSLQYSAGDVDCIEKLYDVYLPRMNERFWAFVRMETQARIALSLLDSMPHGSNLAPASISTIPYEWPSVIDKWSADSLDSDAKNSTKEADHFATKDKPCAGEHHVTSMNTAQTIGDSMAAINTERSLDGVEKLNCKLGEDVLWQKWPRHLRRHSGN